MIYHSKLNVLISCQAQKLYGKTLNEVTCLVLLIILSFFDASLEAPLLGRGGVRRYF